MRSALSAAARRWARIAWRPPGARSRAEMLFMTLLAAPALVALAAPGTPSPGGASPGGARGSHDSAAGRAAARGTSAGSAPGSAAAAAPDAAAAAAPGARYRVVGCVSHGTQAYRGGPRVREVAIGFDDGPARDTGAFVQMLERSHAQATFFVIGGQLSGSYRSTLLRALRDGDVLGDHSFSHPDLTRIGSVRGQLQSTIGAIRSLTGYTPCVFRPPYGAYNGNVVNVARSLGMATVLWNDDPSDYLQPGAGAIERRVLGQVQPGSIIISHDGGGPRGQTLAAYPHIIAALHARGYRVVTIPKLLRFHPVYVPCIKLCDGIGVKRAELPRGAIVRKAP